MPGVPHQPIGVSCWQADATPAITVEQPSEPMPGPGSQRADAAWESLRRANPRVFDGTVLCARRAHIDRFIDSSQRATHGSLTLQARPERFSRWVTSHVGAEPLVLLSVSAAIVARATTGAPRILLGKRGDEVLHYPGLWEVGPSGGITPPPRLPVILGFADLVESAIAEVREEVGVEVALALRDPRLLLLVDDANCRSLDFVIRFDVDHASSALRTTAPPHLPAGSWEYSDAAFVEPTQSALSEYSLSPAAEAIITVIADLI